MKGILWELHEAAGGGDVEKVLASTTKAYSRKPYGEKAWKAAAEYLVKQYGAVDAVKIMHHKAMRRAQDAADKRDVRGLVASVKSTVSTWPVKDILAEIGNSVSLAEGNAGIDDIVDRIAILGFDSSIKVAGNRVMVTVGAKNAKRAVERIKKDSVLMKMLDNKEAFASAAQSGGPVKFSFSL